jgi:AcrR family transcriptional regulator
VATTSDNTRRSRSATKGRRKVPELSRESILEVAAQTFREKGYRATNLQVVADVFGVRRPAIYYYFDNKADILVEIHNRLLEALMDQLDEIEAMDVPANEKFAAVITGQVKLFAENIAELAVFIENETELPPPVYKRARKEKREYTERLEALYRKGVEEGVFADLPARLVVFATNGMTNWMYRWYDPKGKYTPEEIGAFILRLAQGGYLSSGA